MKTLTILLVCLMLSACGTIPPAEPQVVVRYVQQPREPLVVPPVPTFPASPAAPASVTDTNNFLLASLELALGYIKQLKELIEAAK